MPDRSHQAGDISAAAHVRRPEMQVRDGAPCADGIEQDDGASAAIEEE